MLRKLKFFKNLRNGAPMDRFVKSHDQLRDLMS